jgi:glycosyltransferase involved in cell wall biosynthesis
MRLGYLYSRYPVISQTFCDAEMLALERLGMQLEIGSIYPPLTSLRHEHIARIRGPIHYAPPQQILKVWEKNAKSGRIARLRGKWPAALIAAHEQKYGPGVKAGQRARNALYFADFFARKKVDHVHVHFANRAAQTALFLKAISGIPFSVTAHGQDFMKDLGSDELLREICAAAEFVAAETDYSRELLCRRCPDSAAKIHRVYNGLDLEHFPAPAPEAINPAARIVSVGRLVAFKGFEHLIDACAELAHRGREFVCEVIGDGSLRDALQAKINTLNLSTRVNLLGSLPQRAVFEKLQAADIFVLACVRDAQGASDVFPTVILEAMAAARPVISTRLAGISELVVHGQTGILVSPGDTAGLTEALEQLLRDRELRVRYGRAGRARIEQHFRIEQTVVPLLRLFDGGTAKAPPRSSPPKERPKATETVPQIAYVIDRWPDAELPSLDRELYEMKRRALPIVPLVCELDSGARLNRAREQLATWLEFLPDAMVIEAEWRANLTLAQGWEEERAQEASRVPSAIFLRQARFALMLRKLFEGKNLAHVHATSARALVCALRLKKLLGVTVSATIERRPRLPRDWIQNALSQCVGGRLSDQNLLERPGGPFLVERTTFRSAPGKALGLLSRKIGIDLTTGARFWQVWAESLTRWSGIPDRNSKMENRK